MKEVRVKARVIDTEPLKDKLILLGFFFSQQLFQYDRIYLSNDTAYVDIRQGTVTLRIRNSNGKYTLRLKRQGENDLDTIEREVGIDDADQTAEILKYMGYYQVLEVSKVRQKSSYNGLTISLDQVENIGSFIEVKKMITENEDSSQVQEQLLSFLENLGINREDQVTEGYYAMVYSQENT